MCSASACFGHTESTGIKRVLSMVQIDIAMPEDCGICELSHTDEEGDTWCPYGRCTVNQYQGERPHWCPLKEGNENE